MKTTYIIAVDVEAPSAENLPTEEELAQALRESLADTVYFSGNMYCVDSFESVPAGWLTVPNDLREEFYVSS